MVPLAGLELRVEVGFGLELRFSALYDIAIPIVKTELSQALVVEARGHFSYATDA